MKKAVASDRVQQFATVAPPRGMKNGTHVVDLFAFTTGVPNTRGLCVLGWTVAFRIDSGKGGEVMLAFNDGGCFRHARFIERIRMVADITREKRRADFIAKNSVLVRFGHSRFARMKFGRHLFHGKHANAARQKIIEGAYQIGCRNGRLNCDTGSLRQRVNACISAAGALRERFFAREVFENGHQRSLNGNAVRLDLPSGEIVAIVREREFQIARQKFCT